MERGAENLVTATQETVTVAEAIVTVIEEVVDSRVRQGKLRALLW